VPAEPSYLAGRYGEIEHAINNLDNLGGGGRGGGGIDSESYMREEEEEKVEEEEVEEEEEEEGFIQNHTRAGRDS